jgi:hypothetical protein
MSATAEDYDQVADQDGVPRPTKRRRVADLDEHRREVVREQNRARKRKQRAGEHVSAKAAALAKAGGTVLCWIIPGSGEITTVMKGDLVDQQYMEELHGVVMPVVKRMYGGKDRRINAECTHIIAKQVPLPAAPCSLYLVAVMQVRSCGPHMVVMASQSVQRRQQQLCPTCRLRH